MNYRNDVHPTEPPEWSLDRIAGAWELSEGSRYCQHCTVKAELVAHRDGMPSVLGFTHERGCPDFIDEDNMPAAIVYPPGYGPDAAQNC